MLLGKVLKNINKKYKNINFNNIRFNSKDCKKNDIFFAINGNQTKGSNYIDNAINNGAKVIISNLKFEGFNKNKILFLKDKDPRKLLSEASSRYYKSKPKNIIAVTGTNGKTSVANFYNQILILNNKKVASIGTLGVLTKKFKLKTNNTTIDPLNTHKILQKLKKLKIENVMLEASSHGLKQHRLNNIKFKSAIFTNLTRDHIDYHKTFKDYLNSKLKLFNELLNLRGNVIFDERIKESNVLNRISKKKNLKKYTLGNSKSFIYIKKIQRINEHKKIDVKINNKNYSFKTALIGDIQIKNLMFAIIAAYLSGLKIDNILKSINKIKPINGRFEKIGNLKNKAKVIIDYAHTPHALKTLLINIKEDFPLSKINLIFGCGGNRDKEKRPMMGIVARNYCDDIYLTDDNPRLENPKLIRNQIKKGLKTKKFFEIPSRVKAINTAIKKLRSGDILIVAGKGHENYQEYKKQNKFSDKKEILNAIKKKNKILSKSIKTNILNEIFGYKIINKKKTLSSASINSKSINKNSIFFGIKGKKFDGNKFAIEAIKNGAILAISNFRIKNSKVKFIRNPLNLLNAASSILRKSLNINTITITGSAGKTSVKELTGFCLNKLEKTYSSKRSFNNKFGVPLSIFNMPETAKFSVLEAGMDKKGEIDYLTKLIKPNLGLITNISYAHIKNFKNLDHIANAKSEIIDNIVSDGTMVINMDDQYYKYFSKKSKNRNLKIIKYSKSNINADILFLEKKKWRKGYLIKLKIKGVKKSFLVSKNLSNQIENILASISIISVYFNIEKLNRNLFSGFCIPESRGSIINFRKGSKKITIIDESYNSNPLSLKFTLEKYDSIYKKNNQKFLLLGDMLELGKHSKKLHNEIAKYLNKSNINKIYVYGDQIKHTFNKLKPQIRGRVIQNLTDIYRLINNDMPNNSFLMVKGSNSTGLNKIIKNL